MSEILHQFMQAHRPWFDAAQAASSIVNVLGWFISLSVLVVAWRRRRITHFQAFGMLVAFKQEAVVAATRATRSRDAREARAEAIRHPGQRSTVATVDVEALRSIIDRAFAPEAQDRMLGKAILWVDDNPQNNVYEVEALTKMGLVVEQVTSTKAGLEALQRQPYDLVLSDMGRGTEARAGYELLKAIRDSNNPVPFALFSAGGSLPAHVEDAKRRGAQVSTEKTAELLSEVVAILGEGTV